MKLKEDIHIQPKINLKTSYCSRSGRTKRQSIQQSAW